MTTPIRCARCFRRRSVFTTWGDSVKGRNLGGNLRAAVIVDDEVAPYAFVHVRGHVRLSEDVAEILHFATAIGGR